MEIKTWHFSLHENAYFNIFLHYIHTDLQTDVY